MEESYQTAVRRERTQSIQALNFELKYMIVGHVTAFQGKNFIKLNDLTKDSVNTLSMLRDSTLKQ